MSTEKEKVKPSKPYELLGAMLTPKIEKKEEKKRT